jgi:hypothetical protein
MSEDDFLNTLKDCWVGREYESRTCTLRIVKDFDNMICYEGHLHNSKRTFIFDTLQKSKFKEYLSNARYTRVK